MHLCGIATLTAQYVDAVASTKVKILDTRKTLPGLRALEKYAVTCGGGVNHRMRLDDGILIKDNHIALSGGNIYHAVEKARNGRPDNMKIQVECDRLDQVKEALRAGADILLLDNMNITTLKEAVSLNNGQALLEASGGVNLDTVLTIAQTGVDFISVGRLTHSAPAVDIGLDI
jgi:nicotinate-nucleotide pyrophosphorylase (carboxylating)